MAAPLRVPRVPAFPKLLQQLGAEEAAASDVSLLLARASDALLAGTAAFHTPTAASAAAVTSHGFELEVEPGKRSTIVVGVATAPLVLALSPLLVRHTHANAAQTQPPRALDDSPALLADAACCDGSRSQALEEAQTYLMLRRAYGKTMPAEVSEEVTLRVARAYFRERTCSVQCVCELAALADNAESPYRAAAHEALTQLLGKARGRSAGGAAGWVLHREPPPSVCAGAA